MFNGEFASVDWRRVLTEGAADKSNTGQVEKVILEALSHYKTLNPDALECRNGDIVLKPAWKEAEEKQHRLEYEMSKLKVTE